MNPDAKAQQAGPYPVRRIEHQCIIMPDGCELSARLWLPDNALDVPVPGIIEHLPYRKRDGTVARDCLIHPWMASHGYACLRVDMRGNGDSQGLMRDEYTTQEWQDACDVIQWVSEQAWCSGTVGMMGISWGGFNALQVASLRPPALKAIVTVCSSVDRFADDIHYKGGCLLGENIGWAANMLSYSSRPPDPALVGDQWRDLWMQRLEHMPFLAKQWMGRQARDHYWQHGSVCEQYDRIEAAVLAVGGWHDGYRNTVAHLVEHIQAPVKGIVGPWIHKYPNYAAPEPRIGFLQECKRWWDHWLKGKLALPEHLADYRLYLMDSIEPAPWYEARPGRWIQEDTWPSASIATQILELHTLPNGKQQLKTFAPDEQCRNRNAPTIRIRTAQHCGRASGEFFPFTFGPELPDDQQADDALSVCFDTAPTDESMDLVGAAVLHFTATSDKPRACLIARLCDVFPDGRSTLISLGTLNLCHARSREQPERLSPQEPIEATLTLDQMAYRLPPGHRLRLALSTTYWPLLWPMPDEPEVCLHNATLQLPLRPSTGNDDECSFEAAHCAPPWEHEAVRPAQFIRKLRVDESSEEHTLHIRNDFGANRDRDHQLLSGSWMSEEWRIVPDDPLSARVDIHWEQELSRDDWATLTQADITLHGDSDWFYITGCLRAFEKDEVVFERHYKTKVAREFV